MNKIVNTGKLAKADLLLLFIIFHFSFSYAQSPIVDSLLKVLKTEKDDTNKVNCFIALSDCLRNLSKYDTSRICAYSAKTLSETIGYKKGITRSFSDIAATYWNQGNYSAALEYLLKALEINKEIGNKKDIGGNLANIGLIYQNLGDYSNALEYHLEALKINQDVKNKRGIATNFDNIGIVYFLQANYPKAVEFEKKALMIFREIGNKHGEADVLNTLGNIYSNLTNYTNALKYDSIALTINQELGDKYNKANNLLNIGDCYFRQKNYSKALEYYYKSFKIAKEIGDKNSIATNFCAIGDVFFENKNYKQAKVYLDSSLTISKDIGFKEGIKIDYLSELALDSATGNYKNAYQDYKNYIIYHDSLLNDANKQKILQEQMNYDFQRKMDSKRALQEKIDMLAAKKRQRENGILYSFIVGFILMLLLAISIFRGYRQKQKANIIITQQKKEVEKQKKMVDEKNKDILDSIQYAKRLQDAILPPLYLIKQLFPDSFVLYKPKDIVAGDFYWMERVADNILIAAADCTGHGVPGALVSVVCSNALNRTVKEFHITEPGKILDRVRELVLETFEKSESNVQDGMDISLCSINTGTKEILWSGAYNPLWYVQHGEMNEVTADKQPIGKVDKPHAFNTHTVKLQEGDILYLFTDGYADQFGGEAGKKFKYKPLQEKVSSIATLPMEQQKAKLEDTLIKWKGNLEQVDDILVIGIRV